MTLLEKVQELQSIKPPLNETELRTRLDAWKLTNLEVEEFDSNVDSGIKQDPNVQIIKPSFDIDPNVEVEEVEGNSEVVAEKGAAVITDPLLDAPIIEPTIFNNKRKKPLPFDILEDLKNKDFNSGIIPRETIKDTFSKFKIPSVQYDKNLQLAETLNVSVSEATEINSREFNRVNESFENATESYMNMFLPDKEDTPWSRTKTITQDAFFDEVDIDDDQKNFTSLADNPAFRKHVLNKVKEEQNASGEPLPSQETIDKIFSNLQDQFILEEQNDAQEAAAIAVNNFTSRAVIGNQNRILISSLNNDQKDLYFLNKESQVLLATINNTKDANTRSDALEKLRLLSIEMERVAQAGNIVKYGDSSEIKFFFDPNTGQRVGTINVDESEVDTEEQSEFSKINDWTQNILDLEKEYKNEELETLEQGYNFMLLEWAENFNSLQSTVDLGGYSVEQQNDAIKRKDGYGDQSFSKFLDSKARLAELEAIMSGPNSPSPLPLLNGDPSEYGEITKEIKDLKTFINDPQAYYDKNPDLYPIADRPGSPGKLSAQMRLNLLNSGYKPDYLGVFRNVKISDLVAYRSDKGQEIINDAIYTPYSENDQLTGNFSAENLRILVRKRNKLIQQREAYKSTYLLNLDPSTIKQTLGSSFQFFKEETGKAWGLSSDMGSGFEGGGSVAQGKVLFEDMITDTGLALTDEQKLQLKQPLYQRLAQELIAFGPDLAQFAIANKVLGVAGITARISKLLTSANSNTRIMGHAINALLEEGKFKLVTRGKSQDGGGVGFYLGGKFINKLLPFRFSGANASLNPILEKGVYGGIGGVTGSNAALVTEALLKDLRGNQAFMTTMEIDYGKDSDWAVSNFVSLMTFSLIGMSSMKSMDFQSMRNKRLKKIETEKEIIELRNKKALNIKEGFENTSVIDGTIKQKQNILDLVNRDINIADKYFNKLSIKDQIADRDSAQEALNSGKLSVKETAIANERINQVNANIQAATTKINKTFENVRKSNVLDKDVKMVLTEGTEGFQNKNNKAEFDPINNIIRIDLTQYRPGVENHEIFHVFYKMAVSNNPKVAKVLKNTIKDTVAKELSSETFTFEGQEGLSFEQAIDLAYGKNRPAEEYVANVIEFLSQPKYQDLLLKKGLIAGLTRNVDYIKNKIGFTTGAKEVDFTNAGETLKFLFDLNRNFGEGTPASLKRAYDLLQSIEVREGKLIDKNTGQEVSEANVMGSVDIKASELAIEYKENRSEMSNKNIIELQDQYMKLTADAVRRWAAKKGVPVDKIMNNPELEGRMLDQFESVMRNYKPINPVTGEAQSLSTYLNNFAGVRIGAPLVEAVAKDMQTTSISENVKELESIPTESSVEKFAKQQEVQDQIDLRNFIKDPKVLKKVNESVIIDPSNITTLTAKNAAEQYLGPVVEALLGLSRGKVNGTETLNYGEGSKDALKMQSLFKNLQDVRRFIQTMPKYSVGSNTAIINKRGESIDVSPDARGYSIGINPRILKTFYKKVEGASDMTSASGRSKGKTSQGPVWKLDFEPTIANARKLMEMIGITPSGEMNIPIKGPARTEFGTILQGLTKMYASNIVNTIVRSKINGEVLTAKGTNQILADIKAGYNDNLASKVIEETSRLEESNKKEIQSGNEQMDALFSAKELATFKYDMKAKAAAMLKAAKIYGDKYGDYGIERFFAPTNWTPGSKLSVLEKRNFNIISNKAKLDKISLAEAERLILAGEMLDLFSTRELAKAESGATKKSKEELAAFKEAVRGKTGVDQFKNAKDRDLFNEGVKEAYGLEKALFLSGPMGQAVYRELVYNSNLNSNQNRNQANAYIVEIGAMVKGKRSTNVTDEHQLPAIRHAINKTRLFKNIYEFQELNDLKSKKVAEYAADLYLEFMDKGYTQFLLKNKSDIIKGNLVNAKGEKWKNSGSTMHPIAELAMDNFIELAGKKGTTREQLKEAYNKIPSSDLRYFSSFGYLNANNLIEALKDGKTRSKAEEYSVDVAKEYRQNESVVVFQGSLIEAQILTKAGILTGEKAVTPEMARQRVNVFTADLAKPITKQIATNTSSYGSKLIGVETIGKQVEVLENYDKARSEGVKKNKPVRKIRVMDLDDTLLKSKSKISVEMPDGTTFKINATEFAKRAAELETKGAEFDFTEFEKIIDGKKGPLFKVLENINAKNGTKDFFILTARPAAAAPAIKEFFDALGIPIPIENIVGLGDGKASAKANWIAGKAGEGYNDFYFADDAIKNVEAVRDILDQIDVKGKVQLALASKKIMFDKVFNDIIEQSTGIESYKEFSASKAKTIGGKKRRFTFFTTPSAEDFLGLLYKTLGKGKIGDAQIDFYNKNLIDTYNRAELAVTDAKISAAQDFKALKTNLKSLPKSLSKETGIGGFTFSHAARVSVWTKQGMKIPGLSKADVKELNDFVNKNPELSIFTDQLIQLQKGKLYPEPTKEWLAGNITTDVIGGINKVNRKQYLQEWQENVDIIFSDKNLNKLEAAYGSKYREALSETLYRMKTGSNRPLGGSRIVNEMMDWLNNSVGSIMFLNTRSAVLQTISSVNFLNWGNNNLLKAGKAFANQPQYWKDFKTLMNSPYLTERRDGLKINVSESEIADAVSQSKNKASGAINYLLNKGFVFTRIADSFAIAAGGSTFYRNQIEAYVKSGMEIKAAEKQAFEDFYAIAETNQQSSNASKISQQQASAAGRVVLAFGNTPMQYNRIIKKATQDLIAGRGDYKTHLSKIAYYAGMQNFIFNALQNALFAEAFGENEEEGSDEKSNARNARIADGMTDSLLRGVGIQGAAVVAIKDALITIFKENNKKSPKYDKAIDDLIGFSPPLSSKIRKLNSAANTFSWDKKKINQEGFNLNNPAYLASANIVSATTNIPLDRAIKKINNMRNVFSENSEAWQKVAMTMGWSSWDVGLPYYGVEGAGKPKTPAMIFEDTITEIKKNTSSKEQKQTLLDLGVSRSDLKKYKYEEDRIKKILELEKEFKDNPKKKDSLINVNKRKTVIYKENKPAQVKALLALGLTKKQIAELKYEKNRVDKIIELQNKN